METRRLHDWDVSPADARRIQDELRSRLKIRPISRPPRTIAGADMAISKDGRHAMACVIVFSLPDLEELEAVHAEEVLRYPYIPGLLSFRECPVLISAFEKLSAAPDVAMFDGQGIAHPRGLGLASHMGLLLGIPTIGCAKSRLVGHHREPGVVPGSFAPLRYKGDFMGRESIVGVVLRTRKGVRPVYVSPGHMVDLRSAIGIAMMCVDGRRIPRPTREADRRLKHLKGGHPSD